MITNPYINTVDIVLSWWFDAYMDTALKMYYWPFFVAGNIDNWKDICGFRQN
jgi:hypothetical protein